MSAYLIRNNCKIYLSGNIVRSPNLTVLTVYSYPGTSIGNDDEVI